MDVQRANQSRRVTTCPPGPIYAPPASFPCLSLGSASEQTSCYINPQSKQSFQRDVSTHHSIIYSNNVQQIIPDASSTLPTGSQGKHMSPGNEGTRPVYPHSPHRAISAAFQPSFVHQTSLNGPVQKPLPFGSSSFRPCGNAGSLHPQELQLTTTGLFCLV